MTSPSPWRRGFTQIAVSSESGARGASSYPWSDGVRTSAVITGKRSTDCVSTSTVSGSAAPAQAPTSNAESEQSDRESLDFMAYRSFRLDSFARRETAARPPHLLRGTPLLAARVRVIFVDAA